MGHRIRRDPELTVRQAMRELLVEISFDTPNAVWVNRGRFFHNGAEILVFPDYVVAGGWRIERFPGHNNQVSAGITIASTGWAPISLGDVPRRVCEDSERDAWLSEVYPE